MKQSYVLHVSLSYYPLYSFGNDFQVNNMKVYKRWDDGFIVRRMTPEDAKVRIVWSPKTIGALPNSEWEDEHNKT